MGFVEAKCSQCGAGINIDQSREFGFCPNCGTKYYNEKTINNNYNTTNNNVSIQNATIIQHIQEKEKNYKPVVIKRLSTGISYTAVPIEIFVDDKIVGQISNKETITTKVDVSEEHYVRGVLKAPSGAEFKSNVYFLEKNAEHLNLIIKTYNADFTTHIEIKETDNIENEKPKKSQGLFARFFKLK